MTWPTTRLGDVVARYGGAIQTGPFGSQLHQYDYVADGIPVVMPKDILAGNIDVSGIARIGEIKASELARHRLRPGDIVFPRRGDIRKCALVTPATEGFLCGTGCLKIQVAAAAYEPRFLYYLLSSDEVGSWLEGRAVGTTMLNLNSAILADLSLPVVPLSVQSIIVTTISAYDDLIDNNRRRIQLLEDSVRLLFDEWFVRLRFPGYESSTIVDGVPHGWSCQPLRKSVVLHYGKALKAEVRAEGGAVPVYGSSGIVGTHDKALVKGPGIVVGRKGNVGSVFWSTCDFYPIDTVYFLDAATSNLYLYCALQRMQFISTDVAVPGLNRDLAYSRPLLLPPDGLKLQFLELASPIRAQIDTLTAINTKLRTARDLLLPRLMSGELTV